MKFTAIASSLRFKLIVSSVLIQAVFISILLLNSAYSVDESLFKQWKSRVGEFERLLESAIAKPLVQQDKHAIQKIFDEIVSADSINYLILLDPQQKVLLAANWDDFQHLPPSDVSINEFVLNGEKQYQGRFILQIEGVAYGDVLYGMSTELFAANKRKLFKDSVFIAGLGLVLWALALFLIGFWLTRNLKKLTDASDLFAEGKLSTRVKITSNDEISHLGQAFNNMADSLDKRIGDLKNSRAKQEELLQISNTEKARLSSLLAVMTRGIVFITNDDRVLYFNPAFVKIWGIHESQNLQNISVLDLVKNIATKIVEDHSRAMLFNKMLLAESDTLEFELLNGVNIKQYSYQVLDEFKQEQGTLWIFEDITKEKQTAKQLIYLAEHDYLTGLHNRRRLHDELLKQIAVSERYKSSFALLFFDIDDFKHVNDAYGHQSGDDLLVKIAGDVGILIRKDEMLCRLGGDEFAILLPDTDVAGVSMLAQRILTAIANVNLNVKGKNLSVTSSIGIALYPKHGLDSEELLACADAAMYQAKEAGKNTYCIYKPTAKSSQHLVHRIDWESRIKSALADENGFALNFQGVYDATSRELQFLEVLVRMKSLDTGLIEYLPGQFINFAERSGTIEEIDRLVIQKSIHLLSQDTTIPCLSVNISGCSFDSPEFDRFIVGCLSSYQVEPARFMIEITEAAAVADLQDTQRFINNMRQQGCKIAIDDFGAGYSSFLYLKHLDVDVIKIDGLFIHDLINDRDNQTFIKAIVDIAKGLGRVTVAEFVEDEESLNLLQSLGVDMVQGFYLQQPKDRIVM